MMRIVGCIVGILFLAVFGCAKGGNGEEMFDASSQPPEPDARTLGQLGDSCQEHSQCANTGLYCVDGLCCSSQCQGACSACNLPGSEGHCTMVADGEDPDEECGEVECSGGFLGWTGDSCYPRANVSAELAACNGAGACRSAAAECDAAGSGPAQITCDATCQDPQLATCTGTTPGACTNLSLGNETCGQGVCQVTQPRCVNGAPNVCTPDSSQSGPEACDGLDNDCDGTIDNGNFADAYEPNNSCGQYTSIGLGSNQFYTVSDANIFPAGDVDYYRITATETDSTCLVCNGNPNDEDYALFLYFTPPPPSPGPASYTFCTTQPCGQQSSCILVNAGDTSTQPLAWYFDGSCSATDSYTVYVSIAGTTAADYSCKNYQFAAEFQRGCYNP